MGAGSGVSGGGPPPPPGGIPPMNPFGLGGAGGGDFQAQMAQMQQVR